MSSSASQALDYLEQLPGTVHRKLYAQPSTALAVFRRMLPHTAKAIVMGMLFMTKPFAATDLDAWIQPDARAEREQALSVLESLHILGTETAPAGGAPAVGAPARSYRLAPVFAASLRQALMGSGSHRSFGVPCTGPPPPEEHEDVDIVDVAFLDEFARGQWEAILYYMVGSTGVYGTGGTGERVSSGTRTLLQLGNFVELRGGGRAMITQAGFTFLLQEVNAQVWSLLIVYLENAPSLKMDSVEVLSFLFMLGSLDLGTAYSTVNLTPTQRQMLDDLSDFGIVYRPSPTSARFYPTRLATTLTSDAGALRSGVLDGGGISSGLASGQTDDAAAGNQGYIIVETNYRIYAYTSSSLQIAVLDLFCRLTTRFPNLVAGKLTKESVQRAIALGITADQIISYLTTHAHPQMRKNVPVLPPTVVDQIRLWQIDRDRMRHTPGFLMKDFATRVEFEETCGYAESLGVLVWKDVEKRMFFVSRIEQIQAYLKNRARKAA
ncbi:RNA pol II transcription initiation subunit [Lineolata rhizophorae]|uniref:RNA polymerase II transcription factor B subunit 2 n=1 Tax=Lineolata rhizophorae TaxID=578093 RepID=A0A6A6P1R8_9PEZI|nr:RNA pol II transcription initiation subunit [Lineolata rhizophorae]